LDDEFQIEVDIEADNLKGSSSNVKLQKYEGGWQTLAEDVVNFQSQDDFTTKAFDLKAESVGVQRYRIQITGASGEISLQNNVREFFVVHCHLAMKQIDPLQDEKNDTQGQRQHSPGRNSENPWHGTITPIAQRTPTRKRQDEKRKDKRSVLPRTASPFHRIISPRQKRDGTALAC
jgi:hypothetical protein